MTKHKMWRCINFISVSCQNHLFNYLRKGGGWILCGWESSKAYLQKFFKLQHLQKKSHQSLLWQTSNLQTRQRHENLWMTGGGERRKCQQSKGRKKNEPETISYPEIAGWGLVEVFCSFWALETSFFVCPCCCGWLPNVVSKPLEHQLKCQPWNSLHGMCLVQFISSK